MDKHDIGNLSHEAAIKLLHTIYAYAEANLWGNDRMIDAVLDYYEDAIKEGTANGEGK